jgi:hypothetical protein
MKTQIAVLVNEVKKRLEVVTDNLDNIHMIFLNRYEEVDYVSTQDDGSDDPRELDCELAMRAGSPYWEICTVRPLSGEVFIHGDYHSIYGDVTDELLSATIEEAVAERIRFYKERETVFGATAWPKAATASA